MKSISTVFVMLWFLAATLAAAAEEAGSFTLLNSYESNYTVIDHASGQVTGGAITGTSTVLKSSGVPFVEGFSSLVTCIVYARTTEAGLDLEAPCTISDDDGDSLYLVSRRKAGDLQAGGGGAGHSEIVGGTGKYAGISGSCSYDTKYLADNRAVNIRECDWRK